MRLGGHILHAFGRERGMVQAEGVRTRIVLKLLLKNKLVGVTVLGTTFGVVASPIVHASHTPLLLRYELS